MNLWKRIFASPRTPDNAAAQRAPVAPPASNTPASVVQRPLPLTSLLASLGTAAEHLNRGNRGAAAEVSAALLLQLEMTYRQPPPGDQQQAVRSIAFDLAQILNRLGRFDEAVKSVDIGMACVPTRLGIAIAEAARGEALCGLGRTEQGITAFNAAARAHAVVGRLNSADSMSRSGTPLLQKMAESWVKIVLESYSSQLTPELWKEIHAIRARLSTPTS